MSLIDVILQQKIVLISIVFALVPLLAAAVLIILPRLRRAKRRKAQRAAEQAAQATPEPETIRRTATPEQVAASPLAQMSNPPGQPVSPGGSTTTPPTETTVQPEAQEANATAAGQSGSPAGGSGLNDLLSIFDEADDNNDRQVLLEGLENIDMAQLAILSQEVAVQLRPQVQ
ncbi:MAG: hypothetical protein H6672_07345 [Anaerolineaceae bacterium]|nr:hypothetical protein [Anaerolineaceae bacterium]